MNIVIVEDDAPACKVLQTLLQREGIASLAFHDAASFFAAKLDPSPDVLLIDLLLPGGIDGFKVCEAIRRTPAMRFTPIIVMTGLAWKGDAELKQELMQRFGVTVLLRKPFRRQDLIDGITRVSPQWRTKVQKPKESAGERPVAVRKDAAAAAATPISAALAKAMPQPARESPRVEQRFAVQFQSNDEFVREYTKNISAGGMFISTKTPPAVFSEITVVLHLPDGKPPVDVLATVVHATPGVGFGIQLRRETDEVRTRWDALLQHTLPPKIGVNDPNARVIALFNFSPVKASEIARMLGLLWRPEMHTTTVASWDDLLSLPHLHLVLMDVAKAAANLLNTTEFRRFFAHSPASLVVVGNAPPEVVALKARYPKLVFVPAVTSDRLLSRLGTLLSIPVRSALRIPVRMVALIGRHPCTVVDLSLTGARVELTRTIAVGESVPLHIELRDDISVEAKASVRWVRTVDGVLQAGVSLDHMSATDLDVLTIFVEGKTRLFRGLAGIRKISPGR